MSVCAWACECDLGLMITSRTPSDREKSTHSAVIPLGGFFRCPPLLSGAKCEVRSSSSGAVAGRGVWTLAMKVMSM